MTLPVHDQGERFDTVRTFTAVEGVDTLNTVTVTCVQLAPDGTLYDVELDEPVIDNVADPPTATVTGSFLVPRESASAGMWVERWDTDEDLEDAADLYWYCRRSPVIIAQEAAS